MIIKTENLIKIYGDLIAVNKLNIKVKKGEIFSLLGPNGAGKTTTVNMLTCLLKPSSETAKVLGFDILKEPFEIKKNIGVVFEKQNIYEYLTVYENLKFNAKLLRLNGYERRINHLINFLDLGNKKNVLVKYLSKGLKQRVLLARAILHEPEILFLDEPTIGLDPQSALKIRSLIKYMSENGTTIFLTTHNMEEADKLSHKIGIIDKGFLIATDKPTELKGKFLNEFSFEVWVDRIDNNLIDLLKNMKYISNFVIQDRKIVLVYEKGGEKYISNTIKEISEKGYHIESIHTLEPSLEDVFLNITGE